MKKWLIAEIALCVFLLIFVAALVLGVPAGVFAPQTPEETTPQTQDQTEATQAATLPPTEPTMPDITWAMYPEDRELTATQAFVYDCQKEEFTYLLGQPEDRVWPASITKLFSIHVAMQYLEMDWELVAGSVLDRIPEDASTAKLERGDVCTVETLLKGMLLPSGNDAAYLIATEAGREIAQDPDLGIDEAVAVFAEEMNKQARELGMADTHFVNPDGYHDEEHYTSIRDLVTVAKLVLENPLIKENATVPKMTVPMASGEKEWINTNLLVNPETVFYCPYAVGLKTGQTEAAGSCLLSAFDIEGRQYIIGVFGSPTFDEKLDDTLQLFNSQVIGVQ